MAQNEARYDAMLFMTQIELYVMEKKLKWGRWREWDYCVANYSINCDKNTGRY